MKHFNIRLNINYIVFIVSCLKFYTNCVDCATECKRVGTVCQAINPNSGISCSSCKANLLNIYSEKCYSCGSGAYYYFRYEVSGDCIGLGNCNGRKQIDGSNQCVSWCGTYLYEFAGRCYFDCVGGNREEDDTSINRCKCRFLTDSSNTCYGPSQYCGPGHKSYDHDTKVCSTATSCGSKKAYYFRREGESFDFIRCSSTCLPNEYLYLSVSPKKVMKYGLGQ